MARILNILPPDVSLQKTLSGELGISGILAQLLINRGIRSASEAYEFLNAETSCLLSPYSFSDMREAVSFIKKAAASKEKIMIFGDYDADGVTAVALLKGVLNAMGTEIFHYLPHRVKEGYGLNMNILDTVKERGVKLVITVDCGISSHQEIKELRRQGIDVIITDHHEPPAGSLPPANSIINPKVSSSNYKFRDLAGVGVAFKLAQALSRSDLADELDLVCLGTIADVVPLKGENRIIAREGLRIMPRTKRPGLRALIESARIKAKKFTSATVGFIIGPRINASGRIHNAEDSLSLLMSRTKLEADRLAKALEAHNRRRQKVEGEILEEARSLIEREVDFKEDKVIVVAKEGWHQGVLGIVASKLADRFYRPTIIISLDEGLCKGSARSIKNFHLFQALQECGEHLSAFGGHSHAAGLLIDRAEIEDFKIRINQLAQEKLSLQDLLRSLEIDLEVGLSDLSENIVFELEKLEPFGTENPEPLFYTRSLRLKGYPQVLCRQTLKFWVTDGVWTYQAIGFGMADLKGSFMSSKSFSLVYTPRIDSWQGHSGIILEVKEVFFS